MAERIILCSRGYPKSEDFTTFFKTPIPLDGNYKIWLKGLTMWNSWHNISAKFNNNVLKYHNGQNWKIIIFDNGNYTLDDINNYLISSFASATGGSLRDPEIPILFGIDGPTGHFGVKIEENWSIDFSEGELHKILGFDKIIYNQTEQIAPFPANISRGVDKIRIHCDLIVEARYGEESTSRILYQFAPSERPHSLIIVNEIYPIYLKIYPTKQIERIRMTVTDQNDNIIDLNGTEVEYEILLSK